MQTVLQETGTAAPAPVSPSSETVLQVENLSVSFDTPQGELQAVREVSFSLQAGEILALVGESGCGKSTLCRSLMLLPGANARIKGGSIRLEGRELLTLKERELCALRGRNISMVFQDPMASFNPTLPVGRQVAETYALHTRGLSRTAAKERAIAAMEAMGIQDAAGRFGAYPGEFSGGMLQRCLLAIALAGDPRVLLADEPTTALDVTLQAQILDLLRTLAFSRRMGILLVSHDLGAVARAADRVAVMYAGKILEIGTAQEIYQDPRHPYTRALLGALPANGKPGEPLQSIEGMPPSLIHPPAGDPFAPRNPQALAIDHLQTPPLFPVTETHFAATWLLDPRAQKGEEHG